MRAMNESVGTAVRQRKLAAILCADVAAFSRLMGENEGATYDALAQLRRTIDPLIASHGGRVVSTAGDGLLADFGSVVDALSCAIEVQRANRRLNEPLPAERRLELRIGVNLGDVIVAEDGDLYGDGVNIAARLQAIAPPGGICLSQPVYDQVKNKLDLGYRSLGKHRVKNIAAPVGVYSIGPASSRGGSWRSVRRRATLLIGGVLVLLMVALAGWLLEWPVRREAGQAEAAPVAMLAVPAQMAKRTSVAVLPFKNLSPDAGQEFFSDGVTEDIINALGRFSNLLVAAKSASFQFKDKNVSPEQAGRTLDVRYLVEGSVRRAGDKLRITVELTEAATGVHLWSDNYNAETKDVFAIQDEITKRIVGATAVKLTQFERDRVLRKPTANLAAYEFVLRGRTDRSNPTRTANDESRALFQRAIELDPNYATAYAALGFMHFEAVVSGWTEFPVDEIAQAEALAKKALSLDHTNTKAYLLLANAGMYRRQFDRALEQVDQALAFNPSDAECYQTRGNILQWSGKAAEAVPWLEGALRLGASAPGVLMNLGMAKYFLGQYEVAVADLNRSLAHNAGRMSQVMVHPFLAAAYARMGKSEDVARERAIVGRISPFFDAERYAAQFGTEDARKEIRAGLNAAGFE